MWEWFGPREFSLGKIQSDEHGVLSSGGKGQPKFKVGGRVCQVGTDRTWRPGLL